MDAVWYFDLIHGSIFLPRRKIFVIIASHTRQINSSKWLAKPERVFKLSVDNMNNKNRICQITNVN